MHYTAVISDNGRLLGIEGIDRIEQLRDICAQVRYHHHVFGGWGFGAWGTRGMGVTALFGGPPAGPIAPDVDVEFLAREFAVAGGTIRNIVLSAAFLAAADGGVIDRRHTLHGTRREFEKIGRLWTEPAVAGGL